MKIPSSVNTAAIRSLDPFSQPLPNSAISAAYCFLGSGARASVSELAFKLAPSIIPSVKVRTTTIAPLAVAVGPERR